MVKGIKSTKDKPMFLAFVRREADKKESMHKLSTARSYRCAAKSMEKFLGGEDIVIDQVDSELMERYQAWLSSNLCTNSISGYMRPLRTCYSRIIQSGLCTDVKPFNNVYTGIGKTRKRAISESDILKIKNANFNDNIVLDYARSIFLLCFYLRGISFVDLAFLKKTDYRDGRITYKRHKTGQILSIAVNSKIRKMIDRLTADETSPYLLKIILNPGEDEWLQYTSALRVYNKRLKKIANQVGIKSNISSYTVRHSWATIARKKNVKLCTISDGLGHDNENTTQIYLASIDTGEVDRANDYIISNL